MNYQGQNKCLGPTVLYLQESPMRTSWRRAMRAITDIENFPNKKVKSFFCIFFGELECVGHRHSFAYAAHLKFLGDVWWIRAQRAAVANIP